MAVDWEEQRIRGEFEWLATERATSVQSGVIRALDVLRSVEALYAASVSVEREEFRTFAQPIFSRHPSIRALGWAPRQMTLDRARRGGHPDSEPAGDGVANAPNFPLHYLEPAAASEVLGLDLGARPVWLGELNRALDAGAPIVTRRIELGRLTTDSSRFVALLSISDGPLDHETVADHRRYSQGFVVAVFDAGRIVEDGLELFANSPAGIDIALYDDPAASDHAILYDRPSPLRDAMRLETTSERIPALRYARTFQVGGGKWTVVCTAAPQFIASQPMRQSWLVLAIGLLCTGALAGFVWSLIRRAAQVEKLVTQRTAELSLVNQHLEREVDERQRAQDALRQARDGLELRVEQRTAELSRVIQELERANHLKSEFVSTMSHELRTPINVILGFTEMARDAAFNGEERKEFYERIETASRELLELVESTLDIGKLEAGRDEPRPERVALLEFWGSLQRDCACLPRGEQVSLEWSLSVPPIIFVTDPRKLAAAMRNLVSNALKFTQKGTVRVEAQRDREGLVLRVEDTGIGIRREDQQAIFGMFRQLDGSDSRHYTGTGLGLYIARRVVEQLGGAIDVASSVGQGSVFTIRLPLPAAPVRYAAERLLP